MARGKKMKMYFQMARLIVVGEERWCILLTTGDGWLKIVSDFPVEDDGAAREALQRIIDRAGNTRDVPAVSIERTPGDRTIFHHPV
jgi:hypothetical protein